MKDSIQKLIDWAKQTRAFKTFDRFSDIGGNIVTAGMSYLAVFATFAALWVGFGIFGIVLRSKPLLQEAIIDHLNALVPGLIADGSTSGAVSLSLLLSTRTLDWTSVVAALVLLWIAVSWFTGTRRAVRLIFRVPRAYSSALRMKIRDSLLAIGFGVAILLSAALSVIGTQFLHGLLARFGISEPKWLLAGVTNITALVMMVVFDTLVLMAIVSVLAGIKVERLNLITGALMGAVALGVIKILGSALLGGATSNPLLASFAVMVGMLIWFNLICRVVLLTASWVAMGVSEEEHRELVAASGPAVSKDGDWL